MDEVEKQKNIEYQLSLIDKYEKLGEISSGFKNLNELRDEIRNHECLLEEYIDDNGKTKLRRVVEVVGIDVFYFPKDGKPLKLREIFQISHETNETRVRDHITNSVSEKKEEGESYEDALKRALEEELQIEPPFHIEKNLLESERESNSFVGLNSIYRIPQYQVVLNDDQYKENVLHPDDPYNPDIPYAYMEYQPGRKNVYFAWKEEDSNT